MQLTRCWIEAHIPHQGTMCLLDEVLDWDEGGVRCRTASHRRPDNPLRSAGRLGAACGIEYAAQAMAVHGALMAGRAGIKARPGMLASARNVQLMVSRLDDIEADLTAEVWQLARDSRTALYEFALRAAQRTLLSGRAAIAFQDGRHEGGA